jgi:H+-transporting ATPase
MPTPDATDSASPTVGEILAKLGVDPKTGLNPADVQERLTKYGPNALAEEKKGALAAFVAYFWGPIPWMIEAAALMAPPLRVSIASPSGAVR